jgi:hypothetical protein
MPASDIATDRGPERDWFLALLVDHVNEHDGAIPITLTVDGLVISGTLVGVREYLRRSAEDLAEVFPSRSESIIESFTEAGEESVDAVRKHKERVRAGEAELETPHYVHLRNAHYVTGSAGAHGPVLWRGRLDDVSGFSLGKTVGAE